MLFTKAQRQMIVFGCYLIDSFVDLFRLICDCIDVAPCCPCIFVGGSRVILFHFAMSCTAASLTCCCCCDCFHVCFPVLCMRERNVELYCEIKSLSNPSQNLFNFLFSSSLRKQKNAIPLMYHRTIYDLQLF